jgi:hypothetical protein
MASNDRMAALRQRLNKPVEEETKDVASMSGATSTASTKQKIAGTSDRARHTVYLSKTLMRAIDKAFKDAAHDLYPVEVEKADYLETCLRYALAHTDEIRGLLASHQE